MRPTLEQTLTTTATTSDVVPGAHIVRRIADALPMPRGMSPVLAAASFQCVRVAATGDYEVELQAGIQQEDGTVAWATGADIAVATVTQDENGKVFTFTAAPGVMYRFEHNSGVAVVVLLN